VNEIGPPDVLQSYATSPGGGLTPLDEVSSGGNGPAFCTPLSTGQIAILNVSTYLYVSFLNTHLLDIFGTAPVTGEPNLTTRPPS
jgi:hypothetical protein